MRSASILSRARQQAVSALSAPCQAAPGRNPSRTLPSLAAPILPARGAFLLGQISVARPCTTKNLLVVDGRSFVTAGTQNPTMTILALSMRASEHLAEESKKGNL